MQSAVLKKASVSAGESLIDRGLAEPGPDGRLHATELAYTTIHKLQTEERKRLWADKDRTRKVKTGWSGEVLSKLCEIASERLLTHGEISSPQSTEIIWRGFMKEGFNLAQSQVRYGISIIREATSPDEVWRLAGQHRSYGDWWKKLSAGERQEIVAKRHAAQFNFLRSLTPEEIEARARKIRHGAAKAAGAAEPAEASKIELQLEKARLLDLALKSLEEGHDINSARAFPGLRDKMRSSWEAHYARAVLNHPSRYFIYEPIGFTVVNPANGRFEVYHPDFVVTRNTRGQGTQYKIVEIKGYLTETGQRKIKLFQELYLKGDFSSVPEGRRETLKRIVDRTKADFQRQFGISLSPGTKFLVYGDLPWNRALNNFDRSLLGGRGFMPRLRAKLPHLADTDIGRLSNTERKLKSKQVSGGSEDGRLISAIEPKAEKATPNGQSHQRFHIQRSSEFVVDSHTGATVYMHLYGMNFFMRDCFQHELANSACLQGIASITSLVAQACLAWPNASAKTRQEYVTTIVADLEEGRRHVRPGDVDSAFTFGVYEGSIAHQLEIYANANRFWKLLPEDGIADVRGNLSRVERSARELKEALSRHVGKMYDELPESARLPAQEGALVANTAFRNHLEFVGSEPLPAIESRYGVNLRFILDQVARGFYAIGNIHQRPGGEPVFELIDPNLAAIGNR